MNSKEHYRLYFEDDPIDWHELGVTHSQLLEDSSLRFEVGVWLMTDSQLGARIRRIKEEDAIEDGAEYCFYKPDWTAKEIGEDWRQEYQDSWFSV
jgi:hypothetical protein